MIGTQPFSFPTFAGFAIKTLKLQQDPRVEEHISPTWRPVPTLVPHVFHRLRGCACGLQSGQDAGPYGNSDHRLTGTGVLVACLESGRNSFSFRLPVSRNADHRVSARDLVTELRATHGSVRAVASEIEHAAAQLAYIAAEKASGLWKPAKFLASHPVSFPFLLDEDRAVSKAYGPYHQIGMDALHIAHPATLVIDRTRRVNYIYRGNGQTDRAPFDCVVEAAKSLTAAD
jgi:peroxiredoxin